MAEPEKLPLCLVCGERGQIHETGDDAHPFTCAACDGWGMAEDKVDTPYEEDRSGSEYDSLRSRDDGEIL